MPLIGLWMASRIVGGRGKGQGLAVLPAASQGRRRSVGMPRLPRPCTRAGFTIRNRPSREAMLGHGG
jgi:hypothetical protein